MTASGDRRSFLVEGYWPGVDETQLEQAVGRVRAAADDLQRRGSEIEFVGTIFVLADETVFCLFDGREAEIRTVSSRAGVPFERVLEFVRIESGARAARR
jgi:hypothetical protein